MQDAHLALGLCSSCEHGIAEMILRDHLRAREGEQDAAFLNLFESLLVESGISLQRIMQGTTVLGKGWWVEDDEVVTLPLCIQEFEGILAESLVTWVAREIELHIATGQFDGLGRTIDGMNQLGTTTHGVERESTCVAEHIEHTLTLGVFLKQGTVLALVNEETGLLTTEPVNIEAQTVLNGDIVIATAQEEAILGFHKG